MLACMMHLNSKGLQTLHAKTLRQYGVLLKLLASYNSTGRVDLWQPLHYDNKVTCK